MIRIIKKLIEVATSYYNKPAVDWSGSWSAGTLTLPGLSECTRVEIVAGEVYEGYIYGGMLRIGTVASSGATVLTGIFWGFAVSGDTLTYSQRRFHQMGAATSGATTAAITRIRAWRV